MSNTVIKLMIKAENLATTLALVGRKLMVSPLATDRELSIMIMKEVERYMKFDEETIKKIIMED